jgi:arsenate reductase (glutaredoxin)
MITIYHNPRCRKSRAGLKYLEDKGVEFEVVEYIKNPLTGMEVKKLLDKLGKKPIDIIRKQEEIYRKELKGKDYADDEWISIIAANPRLMQRPIVVRGNRAVLGDPAENIEQLL